MQSRIPTLSLQDLRINFPDEQQIWAVDLTHQYVIRLDKENMSGPEPVSTSRYGVGNEKDSFKTPAGLHRVCEVIGTHAEPGQRFESRHPVGPPLSTWRQGKGDAILTRILWLEGLEAGLNDNSRERMIYIHGTHQEEKLGTPASHGCIRMGNQLLAEWTDALGPVRPLVWIGQLV